MGDTYIAQGKGWGPAGSSRALVLHPSLRLKDVVPRDPEYRLEEAKGLALAIELEIVHGEAIRVDNVKPATLIGGGVVERFVDFIKDHEIDLAVIDASLTPVQQRNLEKAWNCKVIDRTGLILEIFGARARTHEGRLQVELAALNYQRSRLVRSWTHLERQRGGLGFIGGPGESQLEIDRRLIDERIGRIKRELENVKRTRTLQRAARQRIPYPVVALVGYTNAGKSSLFNKLTNADVFAKDLLFATLDPTMRAITLPSGQKVILSDTVGFISDLPTDLIAAFRATLEEVIEADVVLHVRDIASAESDAQKHDVNQILDSLLGDDDDIPLEVLNKLDLLSHEDRQQYLMRSQRDQELIAISALDGTNLNRLLEVIEGRLSRSNIVMRIIIPASDGKSIAWVHANGSVLNETYEEMNVSMEVSFTQKDASRARHMLGDFVQE